MANLQGAKAKLYADKLLEKVESSKPQNKYDRFSFNKVTIIAHHFEKWLEDSDFPIQDFLSELKERITEDNWIEFVLQAFESKNFDVMSNLSKSEYQPLPLQSPLNPTQNLILNYLMKLTPYYDSRKRVFSIEYRNSDDENEAEEVTNLKIIKILANKSYVFNRFKILQENEDCYCTEPGKAPLSNVFFHHCPSNSKFKPVLHCSEHLECLDPFFICFTLSYLASTYGDKYPEYKEEYHEVKKSCKALSAELLNQCQDREETKTLLMGVKGQCPSYMLNQAVKYNHKEFIGSPLTQRLVNHQLNGGQRWGGWLFSPLTILGFTVYCNLLSPVNAILCILNERKQNQEEFEEDIEAGIGTDDVDGKIGHCSKFLGYSYLNPFGRLLTVATNHLFFIILLNWIIYQDTYPGVERDEFSWGHIALAIFAISMYVHNFFGYYIVHWENSFWKILDLIVHFSVIFATCSRFYRMLQPPPAYVEFDRKIANDLEQWCMSLANVATLMRVMYWLQLVGHIGPIILNLSRVTKDIIFFAVTYSIVNLAFSLGIVFVADTKQFFPEDNPYSNQTAPFGIALRKTSGILLFSLFDPGEKEGITNISGGNLSYLSTSLCIIYQISSVIILLNLLIAVMNNTVQKSHEKRDLFWHFQKTSILIDFFDHRSMIQVPFFGLIYTPLRIFLVFYNNVKNCRKAKKPCKMSIRKRMARENYFQLIRTLIRRLENQSNVNQSNA